MMREIKFRAWDKQNKYMMVIFDSVKQEDWFIPSWKDRYVVMQYTGLKDKNGIEIYEGDIYKTEQGSIFTVVWHRNGWKGHHKFKKTYQGEIYIDENYLELGETDSKRWGIEVIGNIYENPELLS